jgi:hypothetical protein
MMMKNGELTMWNLENMQVTGKYMGNFPVAGRVELSRVAYGGDVKHTVVLDKPITVYGAVRDRIILEHCFVESVADNA